MSEVTQVTEPVAALRFDSRPRLVVDNVVEFDHARRTSQISDEKAVKDAIEQFLRLVNEHRGYRRVCLIAFTHDERYVSAYSHRSDDDGVEIPSVTVFGPDPVEEALSS